MWTWIKRIVKVVLIIVVILIIAMAVMLYFAPISNPAIMISQIFGYSAEPPSQTTVAQRLRAPDGFTIEKYATGLANIRILQATPTGDLIASQPREGKVILLKRDMDGDGKHDGKVELLKDLYRPHGLALYNNHLYVAESNAIGRVAFNSATGSL